MRLRRLVTDRFRNLAASDLDLDAHFVVFHGPNAQGKTNALEAVHLLATLKPLRGRRVRELVAWGEREAAAACWVEHVGIARRYRVDLGPFGRTARLDGKAVELGEYFAGIRAITFTPLDARIVAGQPSRRRDWLDRAAFTAAPAHLHAVRAVRRCLDQKAAALRMGTPDVDLLDVLDEQLATLGAALVTRRITMLEALGPHVRALHASIAGGTSDVELQYTGRTKGDDPAQRAESLRERLAAVRGRELDRRSTLAGPQLDDIRVLLDGRPARDFGSRGQVRSLVLALKLAEMVAARDRGEVPMFLIDDVSSELDHDRTTRLVDLLGELEAQVLVTTTDPTPLLAALPAAEVRCLAVQGGVLEVAGGG